MAGFRTRQATAEWGATLRQPAPILPTTKITSRWSLLSREWHCALHPQAHPTLLPWSSRRHGRARPGRTTRLRLRVTTTAPRAVIMSTASIRTSIRTTTLCSTRRRGVCRWCYRMVQWLWGWMVSLPRAWREPSRPRSTWLLAKVTPTVTVTVTMARPFSGMLLPQPPPPQPLPLGMGPRVRTPYQCSPERPRQRAMHDRHKET
mmetsp:Transcript_11421/g.29136  ORF Transcript_11421/g.29136 Transcript_11421/m.29136 type:complete len:204 (-) Transcript_11421:2433-3044(-)